MSRHSSAKGEAEVVVTARRARARRRQGRRRALMVVNIRGNEERLQEHEEGEEVGALQTVGLIEG